MQNFSPNMLKVYKSCPKKFYYKYIEKINIPQSSTSFEKGKKIHALADYYLQGVNITAIESALNETEKQIWNKLLNNKYYQKECCKAEFSLSCKIGDYWISGRIDAIVKEENRYYILDYKTGAIPKDVKYDFQTMVYLLCADKYLKHRYESLSFVYLDLKNDKEHIIDFNSELKKEYESAIIQTCSRITKTSSYPCNSEDCKNCEYLKLCRKTL